MLQFILMGAMAAGKIMSYKSQKYAGRLEEQQMGLRLQQETIKSNQQGIAGLRNLEEMLASQRAIMAAKGINSSQGSAQRIQNSSTRAYSRDEQARKLNLSFLKTQVGVQQSQSRIGVFGAKAKMGMDIFQSMMGSSAMTSPGGMFGGGGGKGMLTGGMGG